MQTPFDLGVAFLEIFVASIMLLVVLTATGQIERLLQTQTALTQQIDTQRQDSDLRRFHQTNIPYYEVLGAIYTHSRYSFPVIITRENAPSTLPPEVIRRAWITTNIRYVDVYIDLLRQEAVDVPDGGTIDITEARDNAFFFTSSPPGTEDVNELIRGLSPNLRFNARVLQDGSGTPIALLFTHHS